ncbi:hypothetical protein CUMW_097670, partial [Citrus unshiu]
MVENEEPTYDLDLEGRPRRNLTKKKDLKRGVSDEAELANEYILPNANNLSSLKNPFRGYEGIRKEDWKSFVDKILSENFQEKSKATKEKKAKNVYNHHLGSTGYARLLHKRLDLGVFEREVDRSEACELRS